LEIAREAAVMASSATPSSLPTVHGTAAEMFKDTGPRDKSQLTNGTCPNPRDKRGDSEKELARTKLRATVALESQFKAPYYYISGKFDVGDDKKALHKSACDAIISCTFKCKEMGFRVKEFNMMNVILIPTLKNPAGLTPASRWDFTDKRRNLMEEYGSITLEEVMQWTSDSLLWSKTPLEEQDQEWLLILMRNSSNTDLKLKVEPKFEKLEGHH
jgi:hypothetical protein